MNINEFRIKLPATVATKITEKTFTLWYAIFSYVEEHGQADRFDRAFLDYIRDQVEYWVGDELAQRHLKRMSDAGILKAHRILVRYTEIGLLMGGFGSLFRQGPSAGSYHCYTLPGMKPDLDMARYDPESASKIESKEEAEQD